MNPTQIGDYRFGQIIIGGQSYNKDVIILPTRVISNWWRKSGHILHIDDLKPVLEVKPELLVVGQGSFSRMKIPKETRQALETAGIELLALSTSEACQRYNELSQKQVVAAALHLTC